MSDIEERLAHGMLVNTLLAMIPAAEVNRLTTDIAVVTADEAIATFRQKTWEAAERRRDPVRSDAAAAVAGPHFV